MRRWRPLIASWTFRLDKVTAMPPTKTESEEVTPDPTRWVDDYGDALYRYALNRTGDPEASEDLVQEALLAALETKDRFSGRSAEKTWLIGILRNKIADHYRRRHRETGAEPEDRAGTSDFDHRGHWRDGPAVWPRKPDATLEEDDFWEVVRMCLHKLAGPLATAFAMRELHEVPRREICDVLGISPSNLAVRLHRARLALRRCLETNWFET